MKQKRFVLIRRYFTVIPEYKFKGDNYCFENSWFSSWNTEYIWEQLKTFTIFLYFY